MQDYLLIGEITKPQGVRGELKLRPVTCDPARFENMDAAYLKDGDGYRPVRIQVRSASADAVFLRMEGVETRNDAEKMRGTALYIDRAHAVELGSDSNFLCDLIGLKGVLTDGSEIGRADRGHAARRQRRICVPRRARRGAGARAAQRDRARGSERGRNAAGRGAHGRGGGVR